MEGNKQSVLPFTLRRMPIKKLVLINMENHPDKVYRGFELQYFDGEPYGTGYRVLAYRLDHYVDVYDSHTLKVVMEEHLNIVENGIGEYQRAEIENVALEYGTDGFYTHFEFVDKLGRKIEIHIKEHTSRRTRPITMLAPVGHGALKPDCLPLYMLYQFDFVRKVKTATHVLIDGENMTLDKFPGYGVKDRQKRIFVRYSLDTILLDLAKVHRETLEKVKLDEDNCYIEGNTTYFFQEKEGEMGLSRIRYDENGHLLEIRFDRGMYLCGDYDMYIHGKFFINGTPDVGELKGAYEYKRTRKRTILKMQPTEGWIPPREGMLAKIMMGKQSVFRLWPQTYHYTQAIEWDSMQSSAQWSRSN